MFCVAVPFVIAFTSRPSCRLLPLCVKHCCRVPSVETAPSRVSSKAMRASQRYRDLAGGCIITTNLPPSLACPPRCVVCASGRPTLETTIAFTGDR